MVPLITCAKTQFYDWKLHKLGQFGSYLPRYLHVFVFVNDPISTCSENELHTLNGCLGE